MGLYLTWKLRFIQISKLKLSFQQLFKKTEKEAEGNLSHFQAIASVLAGNFGTGNISGMAIAMTTGGPGALVWMWIISFFGSAIQYASCLLGAKYRHKTNSGDYSGGPMYYLSKGLKLRSVAITYAISVILGAFAVGNFVQIHSMTLPLQHFGVSPWIAGSILAFFIALVILGGMSRVAQICSTIVPVMGCLYIGTALVILFLNVDQLPSALLLLFQSAFGGKALAGGAAGFLMMKILITGFDRAIFATDVGTGMVPMLQSSAKAKSAVTVGIVSLVTPFLVMIVCSVTALVLIVTGMFSNADFKSTDMVANAFSVGIGHPIGALVVIVALILFGYTTSLAWSSCLKNALYFLVGEKWVRPVLLLYILLVPISTFFHVELTWLLADITLSLMLICNFIGVFGLSKEVIVDTEHFFAPKATFEKIVKVK